MVVAVGVVVVLAVLGSIDGGVVEVVVVDDDVEDVNDDDDKDTNDGNDSSPSSLWIRVGA